MKELLLDYARYNLWVNERLADTFRKLDDGLLEKEIPSSFPSIRKTFLHIYDAQYLWLQRLQGISPTEFPSKHFTGSNQAVFDLFVSNSRDFVAFVAAQPPQFFEQDIAFTLLSASGQFYHKAYEMIHHCMNHSTFHRGQLITMGRQVGLTAFPKLDFIFYVREKNEGLIS
jgi:uncharacterized damage-inducible protein DinB